MLDLIETGAPVSKEDLDALAHWIVWITLLLGVKRAGDVWPVEDARKQLKSRFRDGSTGGLPKGTRVFAALVDEDATGTLETTYAVLLKNDPRVRLDHKGLPAGFAPSGARTAAAVLRVGNLVVMVLAPTWSSGPGHNTRIDTAATEIGLTRIWPPTDPHIGLTPHTVALKEVWNLFACIPFEADNTDLLPPDIQEFVRSLTADPNPED
ncbi:hypothetical protein [Rhodococcus sp. IEGM 1379]|uniref:hypothetical protein n=1 Tax=Rhodococcus sp. IEGM 1379 TaxID=3047086 RepID=UPI0024B6EFF9|nr:hypothetical protein [Rhodococcus sp. IEGM 1379]MDI9917654.1 hypothetical protein [Rhodococcus sp. IEGM 1379]